MRFLSFLCREFMRGYALGQARTHLSIRPTHDHDKETQTP